MAEGGAAARAEELEGLSTQLAEEKRRRIAAEEDAKNARANAGGERANRFAAQEQALKERKATVQARLKEVKGQWARAMGEQNFTDAAEAQDSLDDLKTELRALNWQENQIEQLKKKPPEPQTEHERFEAAIQTLPAPAQRWCREHPEYVTNTTKNQLAQGAHFDALGNGLEEWSPEYWDFVEKKLGLRKANTGGKKPAVREPDEDLIEDEPIEDEDLDAPIGDEDEDEELRPDLTNDRRNAQERRPAPANPVRREREQAAAVQAQTRRASPTRDTSTAAPPSRGNGSGGSSRQVGKRPATQSELEAAKISFPEEWREDPRKALRLYFDNRQALKKEGRL